jgi:hypothetical protein
MKTNINTFKASELLAELAKVAPSVSIETVWEHDDDADDSFFADNGQDADDFTAWQSEVCATAIVAGKAVSGSAYLGGTWEKACDHPAESNPEISGYLPQMIEEALRNLAKEVPAGSLADEIAAALSII